MIRLARALDAWGKPDFNAVLKQDIEQLDVDQLPLQEGLSGASCVAGTDFDAIIISVAERGDVIRAKAGIFYKGILGGCSCADDPTPVEEESQYCVVQLDIDKSTAETAVALLPE
jgi:hypothetical protein